MEYLKNHISKIISQNEAIMEVVEPALQKKYHKITGISRGFVVNENSSSKLAIALLKQREESLNNIHNNNNSQNSAGSSSNSVPSTSSGIQQSQRRPLPTLQQQAQLVLQSQPHITATLQPPAPPHHQPLNLTKTIENNEMRKRCYSDGGFAASQAEVATHPQNPERSIIKDLLLNSRGLAVPTCGEGEDAIYTCPLCKINFRSADNLQYHTKCYCQGSPQTASPQSAPISPVGSPSHKYFRSNSFNVNLPEKYNPNTLAKLASSTLKHPNRTPMSLAKLAQTQIRPGRHKPDNIVINTETCPAPTPLLIPSQHQQQSYQSTSAVAPHTPHQQQHPHTSQSVSAQCAQITKLIEIDAPLPSPGPLLGKTRLVDTYSSDRKTEEAIISHFSESNFNKTIVHDQPPEKANHKRPRMDLYNSTSALSSPPVFYSPMESPSPNNLRLLQMCGGEIKIVERREEPIPRFGSSGGSIVSISPSPDHQMHEHNSLAIRSGLHSGGIDISHSPSKESLAKYHHNLTPTMGPTSHMGQNIFFQYPPINSITGYNPLTLPPVSINPIHATTIVHGGKIIPFVPGIPGPNSLAPPKILDTFPKQRNVSPNRKMIPSPLSLPPTAMVVTPPSQLFTVPSSNVVLQQKPQTPRHIIPSIKIANVDEKPRKGQQYGKNGYSTAPSNPTNSVWKTDTKKTFNFTRIADNLSPRKASFDLTPTKSTSIPMPKTPETEYRYFNFEKPEMLLRPPQEIRPQHISPLHIDVSMSPVQQQQQSNSHDMKDILAIATESPKQYQTPPPQPPPPSTPPQPKPTKFLRPSSLPLKPGTFTPKRHHGITPTANTLPLISPETPRPSKNCVQLYLNGHAYTYLGLKCSTKPFYCTVNRPQPVHFTNQHKLSIYSNWQICAESNPHPLGLTPKVAMSLYDSRQRPNQFAVSKISQTCITLHSQSLIVTPIDENSKSSGGVAAADQSSCQQASNSSSSHSQQLYNSYSLVVSSDMPIGSVPAVPGGYESNEDYTYVRGRGRGRYVCSECGIRCKKPSMLKKHIRTHTDVRPYTCKHCTFR